MDKNDSVLPTHKEISVEKPVENINARLVNPLTGFTHEELTLQGKDFAKRYELGHYEDVFVKGAIVAQDPTAFEQLSMLSSDDKDVLRTEITHRWKQPRELYYLVVACSMAAAVQGMDETVINGANLFFADQFGISQTTGDTSRNQWLLGVVNAAPYLCCAFLGCWLTVPLNNLLGRRGTIFLTALISFLACFWQGFTNSWQHLFAARFVLGLGIGPKSTTVPVYAAECAPAPIRGALVMMWQMWTAFGIMLGYAADLALFKVPDTGGVKGLNWRLMLGSAGLPAIIVCIQVYFCPESPRWLMSKGRYSAAFDSLKRLRGHDLLAARDLFYIHTLLEAEMEINRNKNLISELFTIPRNRRATVASFIVMFMQQFCGVNIIAYYSSTIFQESGFNNVQALLASFGFGCINFVFALPAVYTIDTFGRRNLLLTTFPLMAVFLLLTGFAFFIENLKGRIALVATGIYLFGVCYSPGEGPVPFTYSAEAFPLYIRAIGMSFATATTWFFNSVVSLTFPRMLGAFTPQGAFGWYAVWNIIGFFLVLLFLPETKSLSLEELDQVFSVPTRTHAKYQTRAFVLNLRRWILRQDIPQPKPLYNFEGLQKTYAPAAGGH
ncbi:MFS sugar transporter [Hysterangium stoloniferum]|nr:MFS sugar transporter [Hysterangium stoloniferum]